MLLFVTAYGQVKTIQGAFVGALFDQTICSQYPTRCEKTNLVVPEPTEFSDGFSLDLALYTAMAVSGLEWQDSDDDLNIPDGLAVYTKLYIRPAPEPVFGYVAISKTTRTLYVIFRGTATDYEWQLDFMFTNAMFDLNNKNKTNIFDFKKPHNKYTMVKLPDDDACTDIMIHSGFKDALDAYWNTLRGTVTEHDSEFDRIVVSGHSLGAANASLASLMLSTITQKLIYTYTYGKPRVGNKKYSECIAARFGQRFWRIENENDIVVDLPLSVTPNLSQFGKPFVYSHEGNVLQYEANWEGLAMNHKIVNYIYYLCSLDPSKCATISSLVVSST